MVVHEVTDNFMLLASLTMYASLQFHVENEVVHG